MCVYIYTHIYIYIYIYREIYIHMRSMRTPATSTDEAAPHAHAREAASRRPTFRRSLHLISSLES